jgi:Arc/MetJ-type ribon-helix-helix transcriptional regulator
MSLAAPHALVYVVCMSRTIAVRVDATLEKAIEERARASGMTVSEVVRETLRDALAERPLADRIGHLRGSLGARAEDDPWRRALRERNWRP